MLQILRTFLLDTANTEGMVCNNASESWDFTLDTVNTDISDELDFYLGELNLNIIGVVVNFSYSDFNFNRWELVLQSEVVNFVYLRLNFVLRGCAMAA